LYVSIITSVFGLIGLLIYQRGDLIKWGLRMDYRKQDNDARIKIEEIRKKNKLEIEQLKKTNPAKTGDFLNALSNLDIDQVSDVVDKVRDLTDSTGEQGGLMGLLNSPLVQGFLSGAARKRDALPESTEEQQIFH